MRLWRRKATDTSQASRLSACPVVEFDAVSLTYPGPPPVAALREATFSVHPGEYLTIVGRSGSGKSTLLNLIGLLDRPTAGTYLLDGVDTSGLSDWQMAALRARRIGFVFQAFHLMPHRTATENVGLSLLYSGANSVDRTSAARAALDRVGLRHRREAVPTQMSGGERQRVAVARALAARPSLLLCDEPTGNLDSDSAERILDLIDDLREEGLTVLMITHDDKVASRGDRTVHIADGLLTDATAVRRV